MKKLKIVSLFVALLLVFTLASCDFKTNKEETGEAGIFCETEIFELNVGEVFEPMAGVTATNKAGKDVSADVVVNHMVKLDSENRVLESGSYSIKYTVVIDGETYNLYRTLKVIYVAPETDDLVINGDFESGSVDPFTKSEFDNGAGSLSVVEVEGSNALKLEISAVSWQKVSPRVETNVFKLEDGKAYKVSFKAKADEERAAAIQLGELLTAAPWFNSLLDTEFNMTTEYQTFEFEFLADASIANLANIQLLFGFGTVQNQAIATTVYLDDIKVEETKMTSLVNIESFVGFGDEATARANPGQLVVWYVQDVSWNCGAITSATGSFEEGTLKLNVTQPEGSLWFGVQAFVYGEEQEAGAYKVTFSFTSSVAGKIQINGQVFEVVEGANKLEVLLMLAEKGQLGLSLQLGCEAEGTNIGDANITLSDLLVIRTGDYVAENPVDPNNLFGTPTLEIANGGASDATLNPNQFFVWYVQSAEWQCGPVVNTTYSYEDGVVVLDANLTAEHYWFAVQLFYNTKNFTAEGAHELTFTLVSNVAGTITVCGTKFDIVAGKNEITVPFTSSKGQPFALSVQLGWEEVLADNSTVSHTLVGADHLEFSNFSIDGQAAQQPYVPGDLAEGNLFEGLTTATGSEDDSYSNPGVVYLWADQNWCGSNVTATHQINGQVLTLDITEITGSCWFGTQLFYTSLIDFPAGTVTLSIASSVAGNIRVNGQVFALVEGTNVVSFDIQAGKLHISFQAGTDADGQIGVARFDMTGSFVESGEEPVEPVEYTLPEGTFFEGMPTAAGGEGDAQGNHGTMYLWADQNWCGSNVTATHTVTGQVLTLDITEITGSCWFGTQLFLYNDFEKAGTLTLSLGSDKAGKVTICGTVYTLVAGLNTIEIQVAAGTFVFTMQAGVDGVGQLGTAKFEMTAEFTEKTGDPTDPEDVASFTISNQAETKIEGAGIWVWVDGASVGYTGGADLSKFSVVDATITGSVNTYTLMDKFVSDPTDTYFRVYLVMDKGVPADSTETIVVKVQITDGTTTYISTLTFTGVTLA